MNAELLLAHFDRISDVPDAIPRLRQFILDLAIRGQLTPQDPNDEPGSELLKWIRMQKARMEEKGEIKKQETLPVNKDEEPFAIPANWVWTRLGQIGDWGSGSTPSRGGNDLFGGGIKWLKSGELNDNRQLADSEETVTKLAISKGSFRQNQPGDVLIAMYGATIGKVAILAEPAVTNQAVCGCTPFSGVSNLYLFNFLLSRRIQFHSASEGGAQPNISKIKILGFPLPLPPLAEQKRIVAKVDELMALCDRLKAVRTEREARRDRLTAASLHHLNNSVSTPSFRERARFYINHLPTFTAGPRHIQQLRQTIFELAARGKLVEQNGKDEPASELLERIREKRALLAKEGKTKPRMTLPSIPEDMEPFRLPVSWQWVRFDNLIEDSDAGWSPKSENFPRSGNNWGVLKVSAVSWDRFLPEENKQLLPGIIPPQGTQVNAEDFLISRANTSELVAKSVIVEEKPKNLILSDKIVRLRIAENCNKKFLSMINNHAAYARSYYAEEASGTSFSMKNVSRDVIYMLPVPLAPLAEQIRIVAKVDELMCICDQLEVRLSYVDAQSRALLEAVLHHALSDPPESASPTRPLPQTDLLPSGIPSFH
jgi:type I restriction enzyme S subunit